MGSAWYALHHHCAGLVTIERARRAQSPDERTRLLNQTIAHHTYTKQRTPAENPMYAALAYNTGLAYQELGSMAEAEAAFSEAIQTHPESPVGYQGKALLYRQQRRYSDARDVLEKADVATEGKSPEVHYFLGLVLLDLKDYEGARSHAERAYELGYPLPGLARKLASVGFPLAR
jgi:tetratricopeptide (TPR) repeat protein